MTSILVVDDDLSMREFLELMLAREGYAVEVASGGAEALQLAQTRLYDLVITDIRMKVVDGIEVLRGVKAVHPETVVVVISAFATAETAVLAMKEGAYDFIPKPFKIEEFKGGGPERLGPPYPRSREDGLGGQDQGGVPFRQSGGTLPAHAPGL